MLKKKKGKYLFQATEGILSSLLFCSNLNFSSSNSLSSFNVLSFKLLDMADLQREELKPTDTIQRYRLLLNMPIPLILQKKSITTSVVRFFSSLSSIQTTDTLPPQLHMHRSRHMHTLYVYAWLPYPPVRLF